MPVSQVCSFFFFKLTYSCLENSMDREAWWAATSPWVRKELDMTE